MSMIRVHEDIRKAIAEKRHQVIGTETMNGRPFCYSIGLCAKGMPELIIIGLQPEIGCMAINALAEKMEDHLKKSESLSPFRNGKKVDIDFTFPLRVDWLDLPEKIYALTEFMCQLGHYITGPEGVEIVQIVMPDPQGVFPGEEGYDERKMRGQIVLKKEIK